MLTSYTETQFYIRMKRPSFKELKEFLSPNTMTA
jgi:hypothetical protein